VKTYSGLYDEICSFDNVNKAYLKARKNKRYKSEVLQFTYGLEENLLNIQNHLQYQTYECGRYNEFFVYEPKKRLILALPFRDRVVHQALCNVIWPIFEKTFIYDSYACRKGKGSHAALKRMEYFLNETGDNVYCLKMDVRKFFYSINHTKLKQLIRKKISCEGTLKLIDTIIDSVDDPGIPVGNLTSQLFANIYLNCIDHFCKETLKTKYYIRYMDDIVIFGNNKEKLWQIFKEINIKMKYLKLGLNNKTAIFPIKRGIDFLGYRRFPNAVILRKRILAKNMKKFGKFSRVKVDDKKMFDSAQSFLGLIKRCNKNKMLDKLKNVIGEKTWEQIFGKKYQRGNTKELGL
jgi:RNA-directed DNA polymerase